MKAFFKLLITLMLFSVSSIVVAGLSDGGGFASENNTANPDASPNSSTDFATQEKFSRDNFAQNEQVLDASTDDPPQHPTPLDGSEIFLLIAGVGIGIKKLFGKKK